MWHLPLSEIVNALNCFLASSGSISMAHNNEVMLSSIKNGFPPFKLKSKESPREWAGSVETTRVWCPDSANLSPKEAARLVLPTPPLPLIIIYFRLVPLHISSNTLFSIKFDISFKFKFKFKFKLILHLMLL